MRVSGSEVLTSLFGVSLLQSGLQSAVLAET